MVDKKTAQEWLNENYESKKGSVTEIKSKLSDKFKDGDLLIENYPALKTIDLLNTEGMTKLTIKDCPNLEAIQVYGNKISEIVGLEKLSKLKRLNCGENQLTKIDVSKIPQLEVFHYHDNPQLKSENIVGWENFTNLVKISGGETKEDISLNLTEISKKELEKVAKDLDIDSQNKTSEDIRQSIKERGERDRKNQEKLNNAENGLPGLLNEKKEVVDSKLEEINKDRKEVDRLHNVNDNPNNANILSNGRFSQEKLNGELEKGKSYEDLVKNNPDLATNGKIDQDKINGLKTANEDGKNAIDKLGVPDLKGKTLDDKLGGSKLSDIPSPKTLKDLLAEIKTLQEALKENGIDPKKPANAKEEIKKLRDGDNELKITKILVEAEIGKNTWNKLKAEIQAQKQLEAQILVNTDKN